MNIEQSTNATSKAYKMLKNKFDINCVPIRGMYSEVDGFCIKDNEFNYVYEIKVRDISQNHLEQHYQNEILISKSKIDAGVQLSKICNIPFIIFIYCLQDGKLLIKRITDDKGNIIVVNRIETTKTKKNIEGGEALRPNYFIQMAGCIILPPHLEFEK